MKRFLRLASVVTFTSLSQLLGAQTSSRVPAIEFTVGGGFGLGGVNDVPSRAITSFGSSASFRVRNLSKGALVVAPSLSLDLLFDTNACIAIPGAFCPEFPSLASFGALAGWALRENQASGIRLLVGPALVAGSEENSGLGLMGRIDAAEPISKHLSVVFWTQSLIPPKVYNRRIFTATAGIGLRMHWDRVTAR